MDVTTRIIRVVLFELPLAVRGYALSRRTSELSRRLPRALPSRHTDARVSLCYGRFSRLDLICRCRMSTAHTPAAKSAIAQKSP